MSEFPLRNDSYQTAKNVAVTIYKSGKEVELLETHPEEKGIVIKVKVDGEEHIKAWAFFKDIKPSTMKIDNGSKKIEIAFEKAAVENWPHAEASSDATTPLYQKWSKVDFPEEEEVKDQGIDKFLQGIYANASDDAKRAMYKSFIESGGTVLSTNWEDVGKRKVEAQPPK
ncbi:SGS domain containing protein [Trichomonas vaginalis G3]|uniref:SGS domain containing protein n=1 Tax=Trichomonas vaginalis (strain ATCC PRA-98 / G3) TaxID=412133 RepID=A2FIC0_TRIV3|nr:positive regulation of catalytic activity protein [Trichomonas vaginalis G3]EAX95361.1 SGS domain containing protein [Trichomonas vaginalis G3]KAI5521002.1 positive regulation of catalytic activity protein [Trichomonas vaginalis G3]|eukprot:XP_001308291.1 SGS domain containing protein [Trichomonas vaginalis G3]